MICLIILSDDENTLISGIYMKYYKRMLYTATQLLGNDRGEEAIHDVFIKIIEIIEKNSGFFGDKPGQYFVIMVRNHSLNILKKERVELLPLDDELLDSDLFQSPTQGPEDALLDTEALERLVSLVRRLTPATRQVLEYRYVEGYSNIEIADMLGISQSAVSTRINKARKRLKELLEGEVSSENEN